MHQNASFIRIINQMDKDYEKLFSQFQTPEPPAGLFDKIMKRIHRKQRLLIFKRLALFSIGVIGSGAAFVPVFQMVQSGLNESGFIKFFLLLFSDLELVMANWQNFGLALLESLPVMSIVAFLALIFVFVESLKFLTQNVKTYGL